MPQYPQSAPQRYTGNLPTMYEMGPSDARPSSGTAHAYAAPFDRRYGRRLAGLGIDVEDESADPGYASNELELLAEMDDIQANGIFDPPGTHPNIHPDAGVFAARYSLPGYSARERPFSKTEIVDATTGRPVVAVPSGAVALDSAAQIAFIEQGLYNTPQNVVRWQEARPMDSESIANWMQNPQSIAGLGDSTTGMTTQQIVLATLAVGASAGVLYALLKGKKRGRK